MPSELMLIILNYMSNIGPKLPMDEARQGYVSKKAIVPDFECSDATRG